MTKPLRRRAPDTLAALITIPHLAKQRGVPRPTLFRQLLALHARDRREHEQSEWLFRIDRTWRVNVSLLRRAHPEMFDVPNPKDTASLVEQLRDDVRELKKRVNGLYSMLQKVTAAV